MNKNKYFKYKKEKKKNKTFFEYLKVILIFVFPLYIGVIVYEVQRQDEITNKKIFYFNKIIENLSSIEKNYFKLIFHHKDKNTDNDELKIHANIWEEMNKLYDNYYFIRAYNNSNNEDIEKLFILSQELIINEIFNNESEKDLDKFSNHIKELKKEFFHEIQYTINENAILKIMKSIFKYPRNLIDNKAIIEYEKIRKTYVNGITVEAIKNYEK